jgi:hypothetical protein
MKPNPKQHPTLGSRANRVLAQARTQLGRAMIDVLSTSLDALGERLSGDKAGPIHDPSQTADQPRHRLRRMLQSDRGLGVRAREARGDGSNYLPQGPAEQPPVAASPAVSGAVEQPAVVAQTTPTPPAIDTPIDLAAPPCAAETHVAIISQCVAAASSAPPPRESPEQAPPVCDEPIRTRSMARLLASQGHHRRALSIYDVLLAANTSDVTLQAEAAALRSLAEQSAATP